MPVDARLMEILICPGCRGELREMPTSAQSEEGGLECTACGRVYPIRDGIPVMLVDEASPPTRDPSAG